MKKRKPRGSISFLTDSIPRQKPINKIIKMGMEGMEILPLDPRIPYRENKTKRTNMGNMPQKLCKEISLNTFRFSQNR